MDFHILGPIEVLDEGRVVSLGGSRQRALLALMLLHANETLSTDRLIDELWGEDATDGARRTVHVQISRLRKAITPAGGLRDEREGTVVTRERGYELVLDPGRLDAHRFEQLLAEGGRCLEAGEFERAADELQRALALWRGAPLSDVAYERFARNEIERLNELRAAALELQIEADLALGRHADVVGRLPALIREHPYRERLRGQLMLALYRCDRQADALQAYQDARRDLVQGLGIEPGKRLRELEAAILAQDPQLSPAPPTRSPPREESPPPPVTRARRLVTVVVVNVAGSAAVAARLDPESMHDVLTRRAAVCTDVVERHGGTIERFAGDVVVGTFGLHSLHEDDGLRAVRAALELEGALVELGTVTVGINTGDVFVGPGNRGETFAMGDTMHVAAKLDEAAGDGEILLGESTHRLVSDHVIAEPLPPLVVRGREAGVPAYRLLGLRAEPASRSAGSPFVNRDRERAALRELLARASTERSCRQVTVVGPAGIGKSRLAFELIREVRSEENVVVGTLPVVRGPGSRSGRWPTSSTSSPAASSSRGSPACWRARTRRSRSPAVYSARSGRPTSRRRPSRPSGRSAGCSRRRRGSSRWWSSSTTSSGPSRCCSTCSSRWSPSPADRRSRWSALPARSCSRAGRRGRRSSPPARCWSSSR